MMRRTTTQKLYNAVSNNLFCITKAEIYNKSSHQTKVIDADTFKESLDFLCETLFVDVISWHYERDYQTDGYICECSRMNGDSDVIIMVQLKVNENVGADDVEKMLAINELEG